MAQEFKTEVRQLLDLMIHSLYSNRDIFLRELVANAADAIDKARFASLTAPDQARNWEIRLIPDKTAGTLTIRDNGVGMSAEEAAENLGTIARSGTKAFMKALEEKKEQGDTPELIGQFGVGFYSVFMVADHVTVDTLKEGCPAARWSSEGKDSFELGPSERKDVGTEIVIKLKEDAKLYLEEWKITEIIHRYSDFIGYPIVLPVSKENADKTVTVEDRALNSAKAIWLRKPSEVTGDEYQSFYAHVAHSPGKYLRAIHIAAEGTSEFKALLFLPEHAPFNLFFPDVDKKGLQLYVRRVFITDECKELLPDYLRFVAGVVDSSDLPLNVSREILQDNPQIARIRKGVVNRILSELKKLQENDRERYCGFFREFGKVLKEGIHTDALNGDKLKDLAMYESMNGEAGKLVSLADYVAAMPGDQKEIYFLAADSREHSESNPALEAFRKKGYDVLFMTDPIDEWIMQGLVQYDKKMLRSVAKGEYDLADDSEKSSLEELGKKYAKLLEFFKETLKASVGEVRFTGRLTDSVCCLVGKPDSMSAHMERLFKAMHQSMPASPRILELNGAHPLVLAMGDALNGDAPDREKLGEYAALLLDQALLAEGSPIADPGRFAQQVARLMTAEFSK